MRAKILILFITAILILSGCNINKPRKVTYIICTNFYQYDWIKEIVGENNYIKVSYLFNNFHESDKVTEEMEGIIEKADLFVYHSKSLQPNLHELVKDKINKVEMVQLLDISLKIYKDGSSEYDEHIWLSLLNCIDLSLKLSNILAELIPEEYDKLASNLDIFLERLLQLSVKYDEVIRTSRLKELVIWGEFPFKYLVRDYELDSYAAYNECKFVETSVSQESIDNLSVGVSRVGTMEEALCIDTIPDYLNLEYLIINSMQYGSFEEASYLDIMKENLEVLKKLLE